ncbi:MAG: ADP-heptose:LPS heptosyltransferase [Cyclobacteriaceae bacterium]|jgi:ADP-heptose:LPS heptosyltransferase
MPEYRFIQLGVMKEPPIRGAVDLRGLKMRDSMSVVSLSDLFVGIDSFLSHVATALKIPGVVLFGATPPDVFGHEENENLYGNTFCSPCYEYLGDSVCPFSESV